MPQDRAPIPEIPHMGFTPEIVFDCLLCRTAKNLTGTQQSSGLVNFPRYTSVGDGHRIHEEMSDPRPVTLASNRSTVPTEVPYLRPGLVARSRSNCLLSILHEISRVVVHSILITDP